MILDRLCCLEANKAEFLTAIPQTYGYCASIISSTIGQPGWFEYFNLPQSGPGYATTTTDAEATANGVFSAGGAVGTLFIMWACDYLGRKRNIQLGAFWTIVGGALQGGAANLKYGGSIFKDVYWIG